MFSLLWRLFLYFHDCGAFGRILTRLGVERILSFPIDI